jgi:4-hydroxy-tetrahydrodipicolinate synthase
MRFTGTYTALITPFLKDLSIDYESVEKLVLEQKEAGIEGLVVLGTTGEAATVSLEESVKLFTFVRSLCKDSMALMYGYTTSNTLSVSSIAPTLQALKPDAVLSAAPYFTKPSQKGMIEHFTYIADTLKIPIVLYNVPSRSGVTIDATTTISLSNHPHIVGIKEASSDIYLTREIVASIPSNFSVLSGNDDQNIDIVEAGGHGTISVASNILPTYVKQSVDAALKGDFSLARSVEKTLSPLLSVLFLENNPQAVKTLAAYTGRCEEVFRLPMTTMLSENKTRVIDQWVRFYSDSDLP